MKFLKVLSRLKTTPIAQPVMATALPDRPGGHS